MVKGKIKHKRQFKYQINCLLFWKTCLFALFKLRIQYTRSLLINFKFIIDYHLKFRFLGNETIALIGDNISLCYVTTLEKHLVLNIRFYHKLSIFVRNLIIIRVRMNKSELLQLQQLITSSRSL